MALNFIRNKKETHFNLPFKNFNCISFEMLRPNDASKIINILNGFFFFIFFLLKFLFVHLKKRIRIFVSDHKSNERKSFSFENELVTIQFQIIFVSLFQSRNWARPVSKLEIAPVRKIWNAFSMSRALTLAIYNFDSRLMFALIWQSAQLQSCALLIKLVDSRNAQKKTQQNRTKNLMKPQIIGNNGEGFAYFWYILNGESCFFLSSACQCFSHTLPHKHTKMLNERARMKRSKRAYVKSTEYNENVMQTNGYTAHRSEERENVCMWFIG